MKLEVLYTEDPGFALDRAGVFLSSEPVRHNLILTILSARVRAPLPGRYWIAIGDTDVAGFVFQSPPTFPAVMSPMKLPVASAMAGVIAEAGIDLPGVNGEAGCAAAFAGQWSESTRSGAHPIQGYRLYELVEMGAAPGVEGTLRPAKAEERDLMILWSRNFQLEIGEPAEETEQRVDAGLSAGQLWVWERRMEVVSMAVSRDPVERVVRLAGVYTPPERRKQGYAEACVHALSKKLHDEGNRAILYTDLGNPTSNSIYRRIGYRAVAESLRYRFDKSP